jgi:hypothetical protein
VNTNFKVSHKVLEVWVFFLSIYISLTFELLFQSCMLLFRSQLL